jgi:hypothetical protein
LRPALADLVIAERLVRLEEHHEVGGRGLRSGAGEEGGDLGAVLGLVVGDVEQGVPDAAAVGFAVRAGVADLAAQFAGVERLRLGHAGLATPVAILAHRAAWRVGDTQLP